MHLPLMVAVAPNGARKTKTDHANLPIAPLEIAETAVECLAAGSCMIHLHVRNDDNQHSLDPLRYKSAIQAIREKVKEDLIIQITTEAVGIYQPEEQIEIVKSIRPEAASIALREFCPDASYEQSAGRFFEWMLKEKTAPQYILYDLDDIQKFEEFRSRGLIPGDYHSILLVLGRYTNNQQSNPEDLKPLLEALPSNCNWWLCAFGKDESKCMDAVIRNGGHCRVGFENNLFLPSGEMAPNNAASVSEVTDLAGAAERPIADANSARELMHFP